MVEEVIARREAVGGRGERQGGPPTPGPADQLGALDGPSGVAVDAHGDLFIADEGNNVVEEVIARREAVGGRGQRQARASDAGPRQSDLGSDPLGGPSGVAVDAHGDLYIADNNDIEKVTF